MIRRPPRSTRTDTLFPYTTLFRSAVARQIYIPLTVGGGVRNCADVRALLSAGADKVSINRSEEHTSELQSLMRISYAVFCLKKKKETNKCRKRIRKSPLTKITYKHYMNNRNTALSTFMNTQN